jgi:hypothetical protein
VSVALFGLSLRVQPVHAQAEGAADQAQKVLGPLLDPNSLIVARFDLSRVDPEAIVAKLRSALGPELEPDVQERLAQFEKTLGLAKRSFLAAGIRELYGHYSLTDPTTFVAAALLPTEKDARQAAEWLKPFLSPMQLDVQVHGTVLSIGPASIPFQRPPMSMPRPDLLEPLAAAPQAALVMVLSVGDDHRRALREMLPQLPNFLGGGPARELADGVRFVRLTLDLPPQLAVRLSVQTRDAVTAERLRTLATLGLDWLGQQPQVANLVPWPQVRPLLTPQVQQDQVVLDWSDPQRVEAAVQLLLAPAQRAAREAARRAQGMNQLKQIMLALHNYHDVYRRFPPQAIRSKEGKPLLSWRVAILPFVEQYGLYRQFRLDEPWDSEHNRRLLEKMPPVYADPLTQAVRKEPGLTAFVVPLTQMPPQVHVPAEGPKGPAASREHGPREPVAIFDVPDGASLAQITDGTSNTIAVLKVAPTAAVPWTKPDDWVYNPQKPLAGLFPEEGERICLAAFADGSVRVLVPGIAPNVLRLIILMNDGQVVPHP